MTLNGPIQPLSHPETTQVVNTRTVQTIAERVPDLIDEVLVWVERATCNANAVTANEFWSPLLNQIPDEPAIFALFDNGDIE